MSTIHWQSVAEVAKRLGIKGDTVYTWIAKRGLPAHRLGRIWRFDPEEIDSWIRSGQAAMPGQVPLATIKAKNPKKAPPKRALR